MAVAAIVRMIVGIIGNVTSFCLFAYPTPTFYGFYKKKSVEEDFNHVPYIAGVMSCIFWVFYGIVTHNNTLVITVNSIGLFMYLSYLAVVIYFSKPRRCVILLLLGAEVVVAAVIGCIALLVMHSESDRSILVGVCAVVGLILCISPFTTITQVVTTKNVAHVPLGIVVASLCNGIMWAAYALILYPAVDWYILTGHGLGALLAVVLLSLYATFWGSAESRASRATKKSVIQLS